MKNETLDRTSLRLPAMLLVIGQLLYIAATQIHTGVDQARLMEVYAAAHPKAHNAGTNG